MNFLSAAGSIQSNPFVILTFIVAPAILTNASALMVTSTGNRFARAIDRARSLSRQIEVACKENASALERLSHEVLLTEKRAVLLLKATRTFYFSLGAFAFGALVALTGAGLVNLEINLVSQILALTAIIAVFLAVGGLLVGSALLFRESRITVGIIQDRINRLTRNRHLLPEK